MHPHASKHRSQKRPSCQSTKIAFESESEDPGEFGSKCKMSHSKKQSTILTVWDQRILKSRSFNIFQLLYIMTIDTHNQASNPALGQIDSALAPVAVWLAKFMEQSCLTCRKACHNCPCCLDMEDTGRLQLEPNRLEISGCQSVCNLIIFIEVSV